MSTSTKTSHLTVVKTVSDIEIQELDGLPLIAEEMEALRCFRKLRLARLQSSSEEEKYHLEYEYFRRISMLTDYREFVAKFCNSNT